jgi:hypothetical protein
MPAEDNGATFFAPGFTFCNFSALRFNRHG